MTGTTRSENRLLSTALAGITDQGYEDLVRETYGDPLSGYRTPGEAWTAAQNDSTSATRQALMATLSAWVPTYAYEFAESDTPHFASIHLLQQRSETARDFPFGGAVHVDDLGYLWEYLGRTLPYDDDQLELSDQMITYWGRFAGRGDPNGSRTPAWPKYTPKTGESMSLVACDTSPASGRAPAACSKASRDFAEEHNLAFWLGVSS
jgi:para-nitrobenzyl esterase